MTLVETVYARHMRLLILLTAMEQTDKEWIIAASPPNRTPATDRILDELRNERQFHLAGLVEMGFLN